MNAPAPAMAAERPRRLHEAAAMTATFRHDGIDALLERLAAVEAAIRDDRHRQPAAVVEEIARLWAAGETVSAIAAKTGVSLHIIRDRLRRAGALEYAWREQQRHVRDVLERRGAELAAAYEAGATLRALAVGAGIYDVTLRKYLVSQGIGIRDRRRRAREIPEARAPELIAAYEAGATFTALGAAVGVSREAVRLFLVSKGVTISHLRMRSPTIPAARAPELIAAYEAGASIKALAAEAGVSRPTLRKFLVAKGVRLRHDHGWYQRRGHAGG